jgi:hypothetical protein
MSPLDTGHITAAAGARPGCAHGCSCCPGDVPPPNAGLSWMKLLGICQEAAASVACINLHLCLSRSVLLSGLTEMLQTDPQLTESLTPNRPTEYTGRSLISGFPFQNIPCGYWEPSGFRYAVLTAATENTILCNFLATCHEDQPTK